MASESNNNATWLSKASEIENRLKARMLNPKPLSEYMHQIVDRLWLGSMLAASAVPKFREMHDIKHVVSILDPSMEQTYRVSELDISSLRFWILDSGKPESVEALYQALPKICQYIDKVMSQTTDSVLVCRFSLRTKKVYRK